MASNNHVSVLFMITALFFSASYHQAHAQLFGFTIPDLSNIIPGFPTLPGLGGLVGGLLPIPPVSLPVSLPNIPLPPVSLPVSLPNIPLPPVSLPNIPLPPVSLPTISPPPRSQLPAGFNLTGQLCCAPNGNCPVQGGGQGVPGVPVILKCTFPTGTITIGGGSTGVSGTFSIISFVPVVVQFLSTFFASGAQLPCVTIVDQLLSSIACPVLSTLNGTLLSLVTATGTTTNSLLQTILTANTTGFVNVPV